MSVLFSDIHSGPYVSPAGSGRGWEQTGKSGCCRRPTVCRAIAGAVVGTESEMVVLPTQRLGLEPGGEKKKKNPETPERSRDGQQLPGAVCVSGTRRRRAPPRSRELGRASKRGLDSRRHNREGWHSRRRLWYGHKFRGKNVSAQPHGILHSKPRGADERPNVASKQ